ncbi:MAG: hypothetical protein S4CHLAM2_06500 [Chlamydiales bacterium]|nr:hypothetical protein [Chlamydiales bacterium]
MIWKRYFLKELAKVFFLFIGGFYFLYVLIDYSMHTKAFHQEGVRFIDIGLYYLFQFTKRGDILLPIALLISTIKVLTALNVRNEIVALLTAGTPLKTLMRPFLWVASLLAFLLYLNFQFLQPLSLNALETFEESFFKKRSHEEPIGALPLADGSILVYDTFDTAEQAFHDVYWYQNSDLLYRMEALYPFEHVPFGKQVDVIKREGGLLQRTASQDQLPFPGISFDARSVFVALHPPRQQSLTQLFSNMRWKGTLNDREAEMAAVFFYKLTIPLVCLLAVCAPAPFCLRFGRHLPIFMIYALSLCGIITFFTFVNACVILGKSQVLSPLWALTLPLALFFGLFGWRYAKL